MTPCTHTSDWWKHQTPCPACGEPYSDQEADAIAAPLSREFTAEQIAMIERIRQEAELND